MKRILYIEDSLASQWLLKKQLKTIVEIAVAASLAEARSLLQDHTKFDLVIADWALPDGEALEFVRELRKRVEATKLPVIVVSASQADRLAGPDRGRGTDAGGALRSRHPKRAGSRHLGGRHVQRTLVALLS